MNLMVVNPLENHATSDLGKGFYNAFIELGINTHLFTPGELYSAKTNVFNMLESKFGIKMNTDMTLLSIEGLIDEIILHEIDVLFVIRGVLIPPHYLEKLKKRLKNITLVLYLTDDPYDAEISKKIVTYYDYVISNDKSGEYLYKDGKYIPVGVDATIYKFLDKERHYDLSFIGSYFKERVELFEYDLPYLKSLITYFAGTWVPSQNEKGEKTIWGDTYGCPFSGGFFDFLGARCNSITIPEKVNIIYNATKIVPCPHRNKEWVGNKEVEANNFSPRIFECALTKAFQLVSGNRRKFISDYFVEGEDIIYYDSDADFIDKVKYYLEHEDERIRITENLYDKVIKNHTYVQRVEQVLQIIT